MGEVKSVLMEIQFCEICKGQGWNYFGNEIEFDVEVCECNPHKLFITQENK
jgi:hypothetical protein